MTRVPKPSPRPHSVFVVCTFCIVLLASLSLAQPARARDMVSVARAEIHLRTGPGTAHDSAWIISRGYPLTVLGRQGQWLLVRDFENDKGWVYRPLTDRTPHYIVKSKTANLRSGPGTRYRVVGRAEYGDVLRTLAHQGKSWVKVRSDQDIVGWIARSLLWGW